MIDGLVVEPRADHVKRRHGYHHRHAADHSGTQSHQPAVVWEHLKDEETKGSGVNGHFMSAASNFNCNAASMALLLAPTVQYVTHMLL